MSDFICGANHVDAHLVGVNWGRDLPEPEFTVDLRNVVEGDAAPDGPGKLALQRGIEVGHVFFLGSKYSEALKATYLDDTGKPALLQMGCYGIGITRIVGAAIEQNHDARGIIWPKAIAPFQVVICPVGFGKSETVRDTAVQIYETLAAQGVDVILDDRDSRPGVMFAEWELIGVPLRVTVGERGLKDGVVELQARRQEAATKVSPAEAADTVLAMLAAL
jgi:prolyl-tRNA synthetase